MNDLIISDVRVVTPLGSMARKGAEMSELFILDHASVFVSDGIIAYVGKERIPDKLDCVQIDGRGCCLLPGFIDSHSHLVFGGLRAEEFSWRLQGDSYMSIMKRGGGIVNTVKSTRVSDFDSLLAKSMELVHKMSEMGVTTVEGKSGYGLDRETEIKQLEVMQKMNKTEDCPVEIVPTFLGAHAVPEEYKGRSEEYIDFLIREMLPEIREKKLAECCDVFCEEGVFSIEQSRRLLMEAKDLGYRLKIHADEIVSLGGAELAAELHALSADHLLHASDTGIRRLADSGVIATLLPLTAFALKEPYARGREMIDAGCAVALATDLNPGSCFSGSIPLTIDLACIYMGLSIEETITALTLNGAAAVGRAEKLGSIEVGKQADLILLDYPDYHVLPYYIGMNCVNTTIKAGKIVKCKNNK